MSLDLSPHEPRLIAPRHVSGVHAISAAAACEMVVAHHYLHRAPPTSYAFGLIVAGRVVGVVTFGVPASRHLQLSLCRERPDVVLELNRLWVCDTMPRNTESAFVARALAQLPPRLVCSYADTAHGHVGYVYRAGNWYYSGVTDQERKTPRYDYIPASGRHSRDAFRGGGAFERVRRLPKHKYWRATGNRRDRKQLEAICTWPKMKWPPKEAPDGTE